VLPKNEVAPLEREVDRFSGCLIGQALGDSLGFIVEGYPPSECAAYVDAALRPRRLLGYSRGRFPIGQYSDDSQLARELARSLVEQRRFDPAEYAGRIATLFTEGRIVGRGRATEEAAYRIARGVPWQEAGTPAPAAGNGSAMRVAPVGLFFCDDPEALIAAAHDQGRITHQDRRCSAGAIAIAGATAIATKEGHLHPVSLCTRLSQWTRDFDPVLAAAIQDLPGWIETPPHHAVKTIASIGVSPSYDDRWEGISPFVTSSVLWSLYSVLRSPSDYWEAISTAIAVGGDVDTTAAMAGAIAGAAVGLGGIPREPAELVTDQGEWGYEALVQLAHDLHEARLAGRLSNRGHG
jgi:poly(ADP-ribose) glycohydrolase ARH3